jgi:hypothetical protein
MTKAGYVMVAGALLLSSPLQAQSGAEFRDSWFWGVKAGAMGIGTAEAAREARPTFGAEWLVTRTIGALNLSADFTNVEMIGSVPDPSSADGRRLVRFNNLRRYSVSGLAFPRTFGPLRPYGGLGLSIHVIGRAEALADTATGNPPPAGIDQRVEDARSRAVVQALAGVQGQLGRVAPFAQVTFLPASSRFLANDRSMQVFEAGIRYNFSPAIDRRGRGR